MGVMLDLSVSLSLLHNVGWNYVWCRQCCGAGGSHACHVLMVKVMVKVDLALLEAHVAIGVPPY